MGAGSGDGMPGKNGGGNNRSGTTRRGNPAQPQAGGGAAPHLAGHPALTHETRTVISLNQPHLDRSPETVKMKIAKKNTRLIIGAIFTGASLLLTATYIVPIISVLPGILFENISTNFVKNAPYSNIGRTTIVLLSILFLLAMSFSLLWVKHETAKK